MNNDTGAALLTIALFAAGAIAVILYQHAAATQQIIGAIGVGNAPAQGNGLGQPASLAGTPTPGQAGTTLVPPVIPLQVQPGYTLQ